MQPCTWHVSDVTALLSKEAEAACQSTHRLLVLVAKRDPGLCYPQKHAKDMAAEEEWRTKYNKEERKKRYVEEGKSDKRSAKRARAQE